MDQIAMSTVPKLWKDGGVFGLAEPCQFSSSERSDWTAQKKLLETFGLNGSHQEAATANFLSRLSAKSVNTDVGLQSIPQIPQDHYPELGPEKSTDFWLPPGALATASIDHHIEADVGHQRNQNGMGSAEQPSLTVTKGAAGGSNPSESEASQAGLAMLAAASARVEALDSIVDTLRAAYSLPGKSKRGIQSTSAIRRRNKMRAKMFENSSFSLNPKRLKIKR